MHYIILVILLCIPQLLLASPRIQISPQLTHLNYTEKSDNNQTLNQEKGYLHGISLLFDSALFSEWHVKNTLSYLEGTTNYRGQTQVGIPLKTETEHEFIEFDSLMLRKINENISLGAGIGYTSRDRLILPTANSTRLAEMYEWYPLNIQLDYIVPIASNQHLTFSGKTTRFLKPSVTVDLSVIGAGDETLDLGSSWGSEIGIHYRYVINTNIMLGVGMEYQYSRFGGSDKELVNNGSRSFLISEPESTMSRLNLGLFLSIAL